MNNEKLQIICHFWLLTLAFGRIEYGGWGTIFIGVHICQIITINFILRQNKNQTK